MKVIIVCFGIILLTLSAYPQDIARCCYQWNQSNSEYLDMCDNLTEIECAALSGTWSMDETCESGPCSYNLECDHQPDGVIDQNGIYTYRQTVDAASGPDLYFGPWNSNGSCTDIQGQTSAYGGFNLYSYGTQDYEWFHSFPDWNAPGLNIQSVSVRICAYDVDQNCGTSPCELDNIYVDQTQQTPTFLYGQNQQFESTTFQVNASLLTDDGWLELDIDIDALRSDCRWATILNWSQLTVVYSLDGLNDPPYDPLCAVPECVDLNDDMCVIVTGPIPADPNGDAVTYDYTWFIDDDETAGFVNVADHPTRDLGHVDGPCVAAIDRQAADRWKVQIFAVDEHGTRSENSCFSEFPEVVEDCNVLECPYPQTVRLTTDFVFPECACLNICAEVPLTICIGPLTEAEIPSEWLITPGCSAVDSDCDEACDPAAPAATGGWIYNRATEEYCITLSSDITGCFCFCIDDILPVELGEFEAIPGVNNISLRWNTLSENQNDHFEIWRDGELTGLVDATNSPTGDVYLWTASPLDPDVACTFTLVSISFRGERAQLASITATPLRAPESAAGYALEQNYPNPFNPETQIRFTLGDAGPVRLAIYNLLGRQVAELLNRSMSAGPHTVFFTATDLPTGMYLYRLEAGEFAAQRKMVLMK